jgi:PD-(D/E)XK nuclease superfamily
MSIVMRYLENRYGNPLKLGIALKCQSLRNDAFRGQEFTVAATLRDRLGACEEQQLRNYMNILGVDCGLLINFQTPGRKPGKTRLEIREVG